MCKCLLTNLECHEDVKMCSFAPLITVLELLGLTAASSLLELLAALVAGRESDGPSADTWELLQRVLGEPLLGGCLVSTARQLLPHNSGFHFPDKMKMS